MAASPEFPDAACRGLPVDMFVVDDTRGSDSAEAKQVSKDWNGTVYCLCGKPGRAGDEQHPDGAPPLVAIFEESRVLPPKSPDDRSDEMIGEGRDG